MREDVSSRDVYLHLRMHKLVAGGYGMAGGMVKQADGYGMVKARQQSPAVTWM